MIISEREHSFIMIPQHDHAKISGEIARYWRDEFFYGIDRKDEVILAIYEHDRGWIELDAAPVWNDQQEKPYSFMDYPMEPKVACYQKGIAEVEEMNKYAGLLCSLHYAAFFLHETASAGRQFLNEEIRRQQNLLNGLAIKDKQTLHYHLNMLRFCDNLSLYICLNKPGVQKENEHPFFRNGIPHSFPFANHQPIHAQWIGQETVSLSAFPLKKELQVQLEFKEVKKEDIQLNGILNAYTNAPLSKRSVLFM